MPKLSTLQQSIDQEIEEFVASDPMIAYSIQINQGVIPPTVKASRPLISWHAISTRASNIWTRYD